MQLDKSAYQSYLLRLRRLEREGQPVWCASLESSITGHRQDFPDLDALVAFLLQEFGKQPDKAPAASQSIRSAAHDEGVRSP